jgi:hypothetical protein
MDGGGAAIAAQGNVQAPLFHPCPTDPGCPYCGRGATASAPPQGAFDWSFVDAAYCISLQSRPDRVTEAARQFHRVGLCRHVTFFRPAKHATMPKVGIWESHRAVGLEALARGQQRVLIFEDDVRFARHVSPRTARAVGRALDRLPADWTIFFLGHWPLRAWFVRRNVLRTVSGCAHAYVAGPNLLGWLRDHPYGTAPIVRFVGVTIDAAYAALPGAYAYFPMLATQSASASDHLGRDSAKRVKRFRHLFTRSRYREMLHSGLMRPTELAVAACAPWFYLLDRLKGPVRALPPRLQRTAEGQDAL